MASLGFQKFKKIHMIGIGGSGMIGVATILQKRGFKVPAIFAGERFSK